MTHPSALDCTVVVPSHRGSHRLPRLLECFARQDYKGTWELLVVLDGRDEQSLRLLHTYKDTLPLRLFIRERSGGVAAAMRDGVTQARGRIIIRCDDDLAPRPDFVRLHMSHHVDAACGVIGPTLDVFPGGRYAQIYGEPSNRRALASAYARPERERWVGWAANNSAPREVIENVGSFDPELWYGEDSELGFRLHAAGLPIVVDPQLQTEHHGPAITVAARAPRAFVAGASRAAFQRRHPEASQQAAPTGKVGFGGRLWNSAVALTSSALRTHSSYARAGRLADGVLRVLPAAVGAKLVALLVESAGRAGTRDGGHDMSKFRAQKSRELAQETRTAKRTEP
ncbi:MULTISPECIES: glycosyltransferase family 2 protein [unclassified Pseudoclavibacter]|uniref:glycosyltransferase family 2 protein n=1 Tax=unclassified Pseudoclavibacter TaxID=2615177 RepID=UPI001BAC5397|nr:glycosyltransferase family A protein [Pseudoclavibacter sp. Marseille-Q4354]MBS3180150.1 glycosyltransferase family 2 protein [Pseudoclavibacter sp. Marseille-Q4354]